VKILILDNYDSFTFNLYQLLGAVAAEAPIVARNDALSLDEVRALAPDRIVISPGPGHPAVPRDFGICGAVIEALGPTTPILGVCLGHQGIVHTLGGRVVRAPDIIHGKRWRIRHDEAGLFAGLPSPLEVMRYHSLVADRDSLPSELEVTAETDDHLVMAIRHRSWPLVGLQFHPESIGTPDGGRMLRRFVRGLE
jgi:anthranilate synthase/aminodeoxychorismate synthase-like glutamine amidotransferase